MPVRTPVVDISTSSNGTSSIGDQAEQWARRIRSFSSEDVPTLLAPTDHTMALLLERFHTGMVHTSPQYGAKTWSGLTWEDDAVRGRLREWALAVVQIAQAAADTIPIPDGLIAGFRAESMTVEDCEAELRRTMRGQLKKYENAGRLNAMLEMATLRRPFLADIAEFDRDPMALTVANGVLDLATATLFPARPGQKLTKALSVPFDPAASCPRFLQFLTEIFPDDTADLLELMQRLVGVILTGAVREHILPILWGEGSNGKTTLLKILAALLGPFCQIAPLSLLLESRHGQRGIPNDVARLVGVRLVVCSETPEHARLDEARVKTLTGGDPLTGRFLHREFFDFVPTHKLVLITNHKPTIRGQDHAIWRRVALVPFTVKFWGPDDAPPSGVAVPRQDPTLADTLMTELPGILNWALAGCRAWQRDGLPLPAIVQAATAEYRADEDVLGPFIESRCERDLAAWVSADDLYTRYTFWVGSHERPMSKIAFGKALADRGFHAAKRCHERGWQGLKIRTVPHASEGAS
jgi:putative DNA primase/helicase